MVQSIVVKMFDQPVIFVLHPKIHDNIRILFEINALHLKDLLLQRLDRFQCIRELIDLLSDDRSLMGQHICHLFRRIERDQAVSDIIQRKSKGF